MTTTTKDLEDIRVDVIKIISYDATNKFTYFYPRVELAKDQTSEIIISKIRCSTNLLVAAVNHLIEVLVLTYDEFMERVVIYTNKGLKNQLQLKDLIFNIFYEEYISYIRPLLQLSNTFIQVEAPYDKFYFINHTRDVAYRIVPLKRIQGYNIKKLDFKQFQLTKIENNDKTITEQVFAPLRQSVLNQYK